jgi:hypothetical protein
MWNIIYDELLNSNIPYGRHLTAFAGNLVLLCEEDSEVVLGLAANNVLEAVTQWGRAVKLNLDGTTTNATVVSKKRKLQDIGLVMNSGSIILNISKLRVKLAQLLICVARNKWGFV